MSGEEGVGIAAKEAIDLVLMDIQMPGINGVEAAKRIRQKQENMPILALSAFAMSPKFSDDFDHFINDFLIKPINAEDLYHKIKNLHDIHMRKEAPEDESSDEYRVIDTDRLKTFAGNDPKFMRQVIEIFLKRTPEYMKELRAAVKDKDWKNIKMMSHKLKPTFTYVGMEDFTELVGSIEQYAVKKDLDTINSIMTEVWEDCQLAFDEFKDFLSTIESR